MLGGHLVPSRTAFLLPKLSHRVGNQHGMAWRRAEHAGGVCQGLRGDGSVGQYQKNINWGVWVAINGIGDAGIVPSPN